VIALSAAERFVEFFLRSDSDKVALGLEVAQWTSLGLLAVAGLVVAPKQVVSSGPPWRLGVSEATSPRRTPDEVAR
jgi:hypothetical protein